jgi:hypothetical protein
VAAFLCELFVFAYLGLQVATMAHQFDFGLVATGIPLAVASRAANVFPCSRLVNAGRRHKLPRALQRMLWAVGLRGAVAYGLIVNMPRTDAPGEFGVPAIETAALVIVVASTLALGSATQPLLRHLDLEGRDDAELYRIGWAEHAAAGGAGVPPELPGGGGGGAPPRIDPGPGPGRSDFHERFKELDETFLKPLFGGRRSGHFGDDGDGGGGGDSPLASVAGDAEGPALRRPLFTDEDFGFGGGNGGGAARDLEAAARPQPGGANGSAGAAAAPQGARWGGASVPAALGASSGAVTVQMQLPLPPAQQASPPPQQTPSQQAATAGDAILFGDE